MINHNYEEQFSGGCVSLICLGMAESLGINCTSAESAEECLTPLLQKIFRIPIFQRMVHKASVVRRIFNINWLSETWKVNQIGI